MSKWSLLYFDDAQDNIEALSDVIAEKFEIIGVTDPVNYSDFLYQYHPQAILIDIHMPGIGGFDLLQKILIHPDYSGCPVFFISSDSSLETKLLTHLSGAIDFISRNLNALEIMVRLENKIKLHQQKALKLYLGNLMMDFDELKIFISNIEVELTLLEMRILGMLLRNYPRNVCIKDLIKRIWGEDGQVKPGTINTHITTLKPKISGWNYIIKSRDKKLFVDQKNQ